MATGFNKYTMEDIVIDPNDKRYEYDTQFVENSHKNSAAQFKKYDLPPASEIIPSWLYLGNKVDISNKSLLQELGITHILNVSHNIPCYFAQDFVYAQIRVDDRTSYNIKEYFDAASDFLDLINPKCNKENKDHHLKVFVHCAVGKSRSSTIIIQYLMRRGVNFENKAWLQKIDDFGLINHFISDDRLYKESLNSKCQCCLCWLRCCLCCHCRNGMGNRDNESENFEEFEKVCNIESMSYRNSCDYVQKCRHIVCPNEAFSTQLAEFEEFIRNGISTFELCYAWEHNGITPKRHNYKDDEDYEG